jgi:hypothetical protein
MSFETLKGRERENRHTRTSVEQNIHAKLRNTLRVKTHFSKIYTKNEEGHFMPLRSFIYFCFFEICIKYNACQASFPRISCFKGIRAFKMLGDSN